VFSVRCDFAFEANVDPALRQRLIAAMTSSMRECARDCDSSFAWLPEIPEALEEGSENAAVFQYAARATRQWNTILANAFKGNVIPDLCEHIGGDELRYCFSFAGDDDLGWVPHPVHPSATSVSAKFAISELVFKGTQIQGSPLLGGGVIIAVEVAFPAMQSVKKLAAKPSVVQELERDIHFTFWEELGPVQELSQPQLKLAERVINHVAHHAVKGSLLTVDAGIFGSVQVLRGMPSHSAVASARALKDNYAAPGTTVDGKTWTSSRSCDWNDGPQAVTRLTESQVLTLASVRDDEFRYRLHMLVSLGGWVNAAPSARLSNYTGD
jgi:hypothetical protein